MRMTTPPFHAKDLSVEVQTFLYACAFWTVAADESLKSEEQAWLIEQFGQDGATQSLDDFVALDSDAFYAAFDHAAAALSDDEKRAVYPDLEAWLLSCSQADGGAADGERKTITDIKRRLSLDAELARLSRPAVSAGPLPPGQPSTASADPGSDCEDVLTLSGHEGEVIAVAVSADGKYALSGSEDCDVTLWDLEAGTELRRLQGHELGVTGVCFMPDGTKAVSVDRMGLLRMWDLAAGKAIWDAKKKGTGGLTGVAVSPDGRLVAASSDVGLVLLNAAGDGAEVRAFGARSRGSVRGLCFSPDGASLASGGDDRAVRLWDVARGVETQCLTGHDDGVTCVCFSADGRCLISSSRDNTVRIWAVESGAEQAVLEGHSFTVMGVALSPDARYVISGSWDHTARFWDAQSGRALAKLEWPGSRISGVAWHPDGHHVVAAGSDNGVHVLRFVKT